MSDKKTLQERLLAQTAKASRLGSIDTSFFKSATQPKRAHVTNQVASRAQAFSLRPLQLLELRSIYALFAWVANEQQAAPETVRSMTEAQFHVSAITDLRQKDYENVIKFLVDLRLDELKH